jgi:hypothetical protein
MVDDDISVNKVAYNHSYIFLLSFSTESAFRRIKKVFHLITYYRCVLHRFYFDAVANTGNDMQIEPFDLTLSLARSLILTVKSIPPGLLCA